LVFFVAFNLGYFPFFIEKEGKVALAHHLPANCVGDSFFGFASGLDCRLVVEQKTSRTATSM
jgi:hypothetical protein